MYANKSAEFQIGERQFNESNPGRSYRHCIRTRKIFTQNKIAGIPRAYRNYISKEGKSREAIIIANDKIDEVLITQLSGRLNIVLELRYKSLRIFAASIYLDIIEETCI